MSYGRGRRLGARHRPARGGDRRSRVRGGDGRLDGDAGLAHLHRRAARRGYPQLERPPAARRAGARRRGDRRGLAPPGAGRRPARRAARARSRRWHDPRTTRRGRPVAAGPRWRSIRPPAREDDVLVDPTQPGARWRSTAARASSPGELVDVRVDTDNGKWEVTLRAGRRRLRGRTRAGHARPPAHRLRLSTA